MCQSGEKRVLLLVIYIQFNNYSTQYRIFSQGRLIRNNFYIVTWVFYERKREKENLSAPPKCKEPTIPPLFRNLQQNHRKEEM